MKKIKQYVAIILIVISLTLGAIPFLFGFCYEFIKSAFINGGKHCNNLSGFIDNQLDE